ncbi:MULTISPECIES: hypothetical protein [unclassified Acinetobacter]|uniref:hypothetical protein n=1 Tax=unclassified Acinetobacter TaxID=196816 RepID=UPI0035B70E50
MSIFSRLLNSTADQINNSHRNHVCCIENDYSCKPCAELFRVLRDTNDSDVSQALKKLLRSRGYSNKDIAAQISINMS